ncbi:MAG: hypothetical protein ACJAZX_000135 [Rickettsiales bacterium]|jgi:hypothetical protein
MLSFHFNENPKFDQIKSHPRIFSDVFNLLLVVDYGDYRLTIFLKKFKLRRVLI